MGDLLSQKTDVERLKALLDATPGDVLVFNEEEMKTSLRSRVKGQDHIIDDVAKIIRTQGGKEKRTKPIASFLFLGPTGTGKTELCKALAEYIYGNEKDMLLFDCSEFSGPEAKTRLIGTPTGYVGAESGGQLTRPVLNNKRRLVVFDEIEKAYSGVFDLFLQMLGDGRLTEQGSGRQADFTQSIVVMTSNAEHEAIGKIQEQIEDPYERTDAMKKHLRDSKVFRAEIAGRVDRICVFKPLEGIVVAEITVLKMMKAAQAYGLELDRVDPELVYDAMQKSEKVKDFGIRELERIVDEMLADGLLAAREAGVERVKLLFDGEGALRVEPSEDEER